MKNTQAWRWLVAGVLALGMNGFYQDGGAAWVHRAVNQVMARVDGRTEGVLALAAGRADWFVEKSKMVAARDETASCRLATAVARVQTKIARTQNGMARVEAMTAREEARWARAEANRARIEAQVAHVHFTPAAFGTVEIPAICPRVRVSIPQPPLVTIPTPMVQVETPSAGPV